MQKIVCVKAILSSGLYWKCASVFSMAIHIYTHTGWIVILLLVAMMMAGGIMETVALSWLIWTYDLSIKHFIFFFSELKLCTTHSHKYIHTHHAPHRMLQSMDGRMKASKNKSCTQNIIKDGRYNGWPFPWRYILLGPAKICCRFS